MDTANTLANAWWRALPGASHLDLTSTVKYLSSQNRALREHTRFFMELASNFSVSGNGCENLAWFGRASGGKMRRNLCSSACDTAASLILQNRTVPMWVTSDGDFKLARVAERRTRAIQGQFYQHDVFSLAADIGQDALQTLRWSGMRAGTTGPRHPEQDPEDGRAGRASHRRGLPACQGSRCQVGGVGKESRREDHHQ